MISKKSKPKDSGFTWPLFVAGGLFLSVAIWDRQAHEDEKRAFCERKESSLRAEFLRTWDPERMRAVFEASGASSVTTTFSYRYEIRPEDGVARIFDRVCSGEIVVRWPSEPKIQVPQKPQTPGL